MKNLQNPYNTSRRALFCLSVCALILLLPAHGFADPIDDIFNPLSTGASKAKVVLNTFISLAYIGIILGVGYKLIGDSEKKWQIALGGILSVVILAGIQAFANSKMT